MIKATFTIFNIDKNIEEKRTIKTTSLKTLNKELTRIQIEEDVCINYRTLKWEKIK